MIFQVLVGLLIAWFAYNFFFRFLIPLLRVGRQMKRQVREFQKRAAGETENYQKDNNSQQKATTKEKAGEYIDFEEIKSK